MKSRLLISTAVLSVALAGGIAAAQDRDTTTPKQSTQQHGGPYRLIDDNARSRATTSQASPSTQSQAAETPTQAAPARNQAQSPPSATQKRSEQNPAPTGRTNANNATQEKNNEKNEATRSSTNQQGQTERPAWAQTVPSNQTQQQPSTAQDTRNGQQPSTAAQTRTDANSNRADGGRSERAVRLSASLQDAQKTKLHDAMAKLDMRPITDVNFSISVGSTVPGRVTMLPVPRTIVEVIPEYRGYDYFIARDDLVIVEPTSHRIVDVIERGSTTRAQATSTHKLNLSSQQKQVIRKHIARRTTTTTTTTTTGAAPRERIIVGEDIPEPYVTREFPEEVYREVPAVRDYRYIEGERGTYIVEPHSRRVIEEIDDGD